MLMLRAIWWQQISVKRDKNFFLWSFSKRSTKTRLMESICCLSLTETFLFFSLTADHFHSEVSAEAPGREVQL